MGSPLLQFAWLCQKRTLSILFMRLSYNNRVSSVRGFFRCAVRQTSAGRSFLPTAISIYNGSLKKPS
ncbi:hypothetical protein CHARACLAT_032664 [Characodon lateralis]|uniref:Uncharacterized protein n=1 Tax=Characodon lateralis TaxID=208331 RepID=A0ABU7CWK8_9TELE|nr:hypothetical protein [Characodon lateralis]